MHTSIQIHYNNANRNKSILFEGGSYYEWQSHLPFCVFPGNGIDYIWDFNQRQLIKKERLSHCEWLQIPHLVGIHINECYQLDCSLADVENWFLNPIHQEETIERRERSVRATMLPIHSRLEHHPLLRNIVTEVLESHGSLGMEELRMKLPYDYSIKQMERIMKQEYGYGPKLFSRKARISYMVDCMLEETEHHFNLWIEQAGYSDRAHFQREFKHFFSMTPIEFLEKLPKINNSILDRDLLY